jgi:hypothetical protein
MFLRAAQTQGALSHLTFPRARVALAAYTAAQVRLALLVRPAALLVPPMALLVRPTALLVPPMAPPVKTPEWAARE